MVKVKPIGQIRVVEVEIVKGVSIVKGISGEDIKLLDLKPREIDVMKLVAKGLSNKLIGKELGITERTVQTHLVSTFQKLNVNSRLEAVMYLIKVGLLNIDDLI